MTQFATIVATVTARIASGETVKREHTIIVDSALALSYLENLPAAMELQRNPKLATIKTVVVSKVGGEIARREHDITIDGAFLAGYLDSLPSAMDLLNAPPPPVEQSGAQETHILAGEQTNESAGETVSGDAATAAEPQPLPLDPGAASAGAGADASAPAPAPDSIQGGE